MDIPHADPQWRKVYRTHAAKWNQCQFLNSHATLWIKMIWAGTDSTELTPTCNIRKQYSFVWVTISYYTNNGKKAINSLITKHL